MQITNDLRYDKLLIEDLPRKCLLCEKGELNQRGHILPKLVLRWLKKASKNEKFYFNRTSERFQDSLAFKIMCERCEAKTSLYEKNFCDSYFKKYYRQKKISDLDDNVFIFAISVAWRVIVANLYSKEASANTRKYHGNFESEMRGFLAAVFEGEDPTKLAVDVYAFSGNDIETNLPSKVVNLSHLRYAMCAGLSAHSLFYDPEQFDGRWFSASLGRVPIIYLKLGVFYFLVVPSGYFLGATFDLKAKRIGTKFGIYQVSYTDHFIGFLNMASGGEFDEVSQIQTDVRYDVRRR